MSEELKQNTASFIQAQMVAFEQAAGWIFWAWKTESAPEWDFQALAGAGVIPSLGSLGEWRETYRPWTPLLTHVQTPPCAVDEASTSPTTFLSMQSAIDVVNDL